MSNNINNHEHHPWSEGHYFKSQAQFYSWIRSGIRGMWKRYPIKNQFISNNRYKACIGKGGREVWASDCSICGQAYSLSKMQVDHIVPSGSLRSMEDVATFMGRMFLVDDVTKLRMVCVPCHEVITYAEKNGLTMEEAEVMKSLPKFKKLSTNEKRKELKALGLDSEGLVKDLIPRYEKHLKKLIKK